MTSAKLFAQLCSNQKLFSPKTKKFLSTMADTDIPSRFPVKVPVFLYSKAGLFLTCTDKETIKTIPNDQAGAEWIIEKSGKEFFLSSIQHDRRLMCSPKGDLSGSKNRQSWEKWRMIDAGEGYWFLESNHHRGKFLSSDENGNVFTTENKLSHGEKWAIEKRFVLLCFMHFFILFCFVLFCFVLSVYFSFLLIFLSCSLLLVQ